MPGRLQVGKGYEGRQSVISAGFRESGEEGRRRESELRGWLARLGQGMAFHNGYQSHAATETCPGHSTILTGDHPARTGIIGNTWIDQSIESYPARSRTIV